MAILLTGGTGKTATRLAQLLQAAKIPLLLASRGAPSGPNSETPAVKFDWLDATTFSSPFQHNFPNGERITAIYVITPQVQDPTEPVNSFIDVAVKHGVKRFVVLTGSSCELGGRHAGKVWQYLVDSKLDFCILRATWFMENFSQRQHFESIKAESRIYSACGEGKCPLVSAGDIAAVAFRALTDEQSHNTDYRVLGPELLTHDQIAEKLSNGLGRKIENVKITGEETAKRWRSLGVPEHTAKIMESIEVATANGVEERENRVVEEVTGKQAQNFDDWVKENRLAWD